MARVGPTEVDTSFGLIVPIADHRHNRQHLGTTLFAAFMGYLLDLSLVPAMTGIEERRSMHVVDLSETSLTLRCCKLIGECSPTRSHPIHRSYSRVVV
jgi:hypothetical protein